MPDLISLTYQQATAFLKTLNLKTGHITYEPNKAVNLVLRQRLHEREIAPGDSIDECSCIDLVLGK